MLKAPKQPVSIIKSQHTQSVDAMSGCHSHSSLKHHQSTHMNTHEHTHSNTRTHTHTPTHTVLSRLLVP